MSRSVTLVSLAIVQCKSLIKVQNRIDPMLCEMNKILSQLHHLGPMTDQISENQITKTSSVKL